MKHLLLIAALLSTFFSATAQQQRVWRDLEGLWLLNDSGLTSEWYYNDHGEMNHRCYQVIDQDTIIYSHGIVRCEDQIIMLYLTIDSLRNNANQTFRLAGERNNTIRWQNISPTVHPQTMEWIVGNPHEGMLIVDGATSPMTEPVKRLHANFNFRLHAGLNATLMQGIKQRTYNYRQNRPETGYQMGIAIGLRANESPLGFNIELDYAHRNSRANTSWKNQDETVQTRDGIYHNTDLIISLVPEYQFGARRNLVLSMGVYGLIEMKRSFEGNWTNDYPRLDFWHHPNQDWHREYGVLAGLAYELPGKERNMFHPYVYLRGMKGVAPIQASTLTIGLGFRMGS